MRTSRALASSVALILAEACAPAGIDAVAPTDSATDGQTETPDTRPDGTPPDVGSPDAGSITGKVLVTTWYGSGGRLYAVDVASQRVETLRRWVAQEDGETGDRHLLLAGERAYLYGRGTVEGFWIGAWGEPFVRFAVGQSRTLNTAALCDGALWIGTAEARYLTAYDPDTGVETRSIDLLKAFPTGHGFSVQSMLVLRGRLYASIARTDAAGNLLVQVDCTRARVDASWSVGNDAWLARDPADDATAFLVQATTGDASALFRFDPRAGGLGALLRDAGTASILGVDLAADGTLVTTEAVFPGGTGWDSYGVCSPPTGAPATSTERQSCETLGPVRMVGPATAWAAAGPCAHNLPHWTKIFRFDTNGCVAQGHIDVDFVGVPVDFLSP